MRTSEILEDESLQGLGDPFAKQIEKARRAAPDAFEEVIQFDPAEALGNYACDVMRGNIGVRIGFRAEACGCVVADVLHNP